MFLNLQNSFLQDYLEYVEETETPRIMHIWAALSGVGACLGRRVQLPFGITDIYANMFVLLVGPPGVRKSTAINLMQKRLRHSTKVRFAPEDTAGARQGLIIALENKDEEADEKEKVDLEAAAATLDLEQLKNYNIKVDNRDDHVMYSVASELSWCIGYGSREMATFLYKMCD